MPEKGQWQSFPRRFVSPDRDILDIRGLLDWVTRLLPIYDPKGGNLTQVSAPGIAVETVDTEASNVLSSKSFYWIKLQVAKH